MRNGTQSEGDHPEEGCSTKVALHLVRISCVAFPSLILFTFGVGVTGRLGTPTFFSGLLLPSFFLVGAVLAALRNVPRLSGALTAISTICLLAPNAIQMGYGIFYVGKHFPLIDHHLIALDKMLGFDWRMMLGWFNEHPGLTAILRYPYGTLDFQAILSLCILIWTKNHNRLCVLVCANSLALILVHLFAIFAPAIGAYGALQISAADHPAIELTALGLTVAPSLALREASELVIPTSGLMGLMTFPSYHSAWGALVAWALWPYRWLRVAGVVLGSSVVISALIHGSHHLTDALAGIILTAACVGLAVQFRRGLSAYILSKLTAGLEGRSHYPIPHNGAAPAIS